MTTATELSARDPNLQRLMADQLAVAFLAAARAAMDQGNPGKAAALADYAEGFARYRDRPYRRGRRTW